MTNKTPEVLIYPRTSEEVVAAACERAYWWADAIRMVGGRAEPCERHSCFNWKEINANTDMGYIGGTDRDPSEPSDGYSLRSHSFFGDDVDIRYDVSH